MHRPTWILLPLLCFGVLEASAVQAQVPINTAIQQPRDLKRLTIEELADLPVTTPARRQERLSDVAAAVTVLRQEDLRRAGVTSLGDALRLADSLHVAQVYGPGWAISTRGFNISTANKLLVLIDGRTVYSPLFAGVFWDVQDVVLADIDRIEVIRGPGGTLWGANAVNGVVNIITRSAAETQGGWATLTAGNETRAIATGRYGGTIGASPYRVYAKFRSDDDHVFATGAPGLDDVQFGQTGFRVESAPASASSWLVQGDLYYGSEGLYDRADTRVSGGNVLGRWLHRQSANAQFQAQVYYDQANRRVQRQYRATQRTVDIDTQQQLQLGRRHSVVVGAGVRLTHSDDLGDGPGFFFDPQVDTSMRVSAFAQDEISLRPNRLTVIVGSKVEGNSYTGVEFLPNVRVRLTPDPRQTVWGAVSRAVRMPTRFDTDLRILVPNTDRLFLTGSADFRSENVTAYEAGYRVRPMTRLSLDVATFFNDWNDIRSQELPLAPGSPIVLGNGFTAATSGVELAGTVTLTSKWQAHGSYSYLHNELTPDPSSRDVTGGVFEANDPSHLFSVRTSVDLPRGFELDAHLRYVSSLPAPAVKAYTELAARLGWRTSDRWDLALLGQNLLHDRHEEFASTTPREQFERSISLRTGWRF